MRRVVMQNSEPGSTREATDRLIKILNSNYAKADLKQIADNATQLNTEERNQLLRILKYFEDLFADNLGEWETYPVYLELKPGSKPVNSKYHSVSRINNETFYKDLK